MFVTKLDKFTNWEINSYLESKWKLKFTLEVIPHLNPIGEYEQERYEKERAYQRLMKIRKLISGFEFGADDGEIY